MATLPAIFFGHGSPMNAVTDNAYTAAWREIGKTRPRPRAILAISAHWYVPGTGVTVSTSPRTIHDFGGFPDELFRVQYPAPGDAALARRVEELLAPLPVQRDESWGLDHGTWSVLCRVYPQADIPVVQLSIDRTKPPAFHYEIGQRLAPLRDEGVLIAGSGNVVHNLRRLVWSPDAEPHDWAARFETQIRQTLQARDFAPLIAYEKLGPDAMLAIPTPEHYLPLLYVMGAAQARDAIRFPVEGIDVGSISMLAVEVGGDGA
ncbi:MAG: 4,5-DOPA dioxygenase extradiol [Bryobacterales bacterium]|nr:4,5-DOPA dioxygenase extradiol [Bryobacterales bacterium]